MKKLPLGFIAFLQALGLAVYCGLISLIMLNGETWFGRVPNFYGPLLLLCLLVTSALISALITLGYPVILFWKMNQPVKAVKLVIYTAGWSAAFVALLLIGIILIQK